MKIVDAQLDCTSSYDDLDNNETIPIALHDDDIDIYMAFIWECEVVIVLF